MNQASLSGRKRLRPGYFLFIELAAVVVFFSYCAALALKLGRIFPAITPLSGALTILTPVAAYVLADFFSGFIHFLGDSFGSETTPFFGPNFIHPFRSHHVDEKAITRHGFLEVNGINCLLSLAVLVPVYYALGVNPSLSAFVAGELVLFLVFFIFLTNQIHKWAHMDAPPTLVAWLQRRRVILPPEHHQIHHTAPFSTYYCITSGWLNLFLQRSRFFEALYRWLKRSS